MYLVYSWTLFILTGDIGLGTWVHSYSAKCYSYTVKPSPENLIPKAPRPNQPQPSSTQFKTPIGTKGTGADTKLLLATHPPVNF